MLIFYWVLIGASIAVYVLVRRHNEARYREVRREEFDAGLTEPASLHPLIDESVCIGCNACVEACPEEDILGLIDGKAVLVAPTRCIGHGACAVSCPVKAITLVFGTEKRGVDIPHVKPNFETNVPGLFIAGELGGMGLIRNAVEQGRQAVRGVRAYLAGQPKPEGACDVLIVGAGPAGFSASLAALEAGMDYVTLEQETLGGTVSHYPRGKIVMTQPAVLPIVGKMRFAETSKERLLEFWKDVEQKTGVAIRYSEPVTQVSRKESFFEVQTPVQTYSARAVLLAIGRRGTPRKLGVPGEELSKVVYRLADPEQYASQRVLVVGGGDSALEAALSLADTPGTAVTLSYRGDAFTRAKSKNRNKAAAAEESGRLQVLMKSQVKRIDPDSVLLDHDGEERTLPNDAVIVCAGGVLPTPFLREMGIEIETKHGTA